MCLSAGNLELTCCSFDTEPKVSFAFVLIDHRRDPLMGCAAVLAIVDEVPTKHKTGPAEMIKIYYTIRI